MQIGVAPLCKLSLPLCKQSPPLLPFSPLLLRHFLLFHLLSVIACSFKHHHPLSLHHSTWLIEWLCINILAEYLVWGFYFQISPWRIQDLMDEWWLKEDCSKHWRFFNFIKMLILNNFPHKVAHLIKYRVYHLIVYSFLKHLFEVW